MQTREKIFGITCPACGDTFEKEMNTAVFSATEDRELILTNQFGIQHCPNCGHEFVLNYRFAYTDDEIKFMIVNDPQFVDGKARLAFKSSLTLLDKFHKEEQEKYLTRMTSDIEELREKIVIFENYLSDKAIEIMKYILLESNELAFDHDDVISFRLVDGNTYLIKTTDGKEYTLGFVREVYDKIISQYDGLFDTENAVKVDKNWAYEFVK